MFRERPDYWGKERKACPSKNNRGRRRRLRAFEGLAKEAVGAVLSDEEMTSEGRAEREGFSNGGRKEYFRNVRRPTRELLRTPRFPRSIEE